MPSPIPVDIFAKGTSWMKTLKFSKDRLDMIKEIFDEAIKQGTVAVFPGAYMWFYLILFQLTYVIQTKRLVQDSSRFSIARPAT